MVSDAIHKSQLAPGNTHVFYGKVARKASRLVMEQAAIYSGEAYAAMEQALLPCVWLTGRNLEQSGHKTTVRSGARQRKELFKEYLPQEIPSRYKLCEGTIMRSKEVHFRKIWTRWIAARKPSRV